MSFSQTVEDLHTTVQEYSCFPWLMFFAQRKETSAGTRSPRWSRNWSLAMYPAALKRKIAVGGVRANRDSRHHRCFGVSGSLCRGFQNGCSGFVGISSSRKLST